MFGRIFTFNKPENATTSYKAKGGKFQVWYDASKWTQTKSDDPSKATFQMSDGDLYGMLIAERMEMEPDGLKDMAIKNAIAVAPDAKITFEEVRKVNGKTVTCLKLEGTIQTIKFIYYGYYYAGKLGTVQLITYTSQNLFSEYEADMTEFLNGLVIND